MISYKLTNKLYFLGVPPTHCNWVQDFKLYTLFTHDCVDYQNNTSIIKFADDTTVIGLITGGDRSAYRREVADLVKCQDNNLPLNVNKNQGDDCRSKEEEGSALKTLTLVRLRWREGVVSDSWVFTSLRIQEC